MTTEIPAPHVCQFCRTSFATHQGVALHRVRCQSNPDRKVWSRKGTKNGRTPRIDGIPTSLCHNAKITTGKKHTHGDKYCTKCGNPCYWKTNRALDTVWICKGRCNSMISHQDGYCLKCWNKKNRKQSKNLDLDADQYEDTI